MRAILFFLFICFVSFLAIHGFIPQIDSLSVESVKHILSNSSVTLLAFALISNFCLFLLFALRWRLMLPLNSGLSLNELALNRLVGFSVSYLTPGNQIGGEPLQIVLLGKRKNLSARQATEAVLLERGVDFVANGFLILLFTIAFGSELLNIMNGSPASFLLILLCAVLVWIAFWYGKDKVDWENIRKRFSKPVLSRISMYSLLIWLLLLFEFWLLFAAIGLYLNVSQLILLILAVRLAFWLPMPLPAAAGAMEASLVIAASLSFVAASDALAVAVLIRLRDMFFVTTGLLWFWIESGQWIFSAISKPLSSDGGIEFE